MRRADLVDFSGNGESNFIWRTDGGCCEIAVNLFADVAFAGGVSEIGFSGKRFRPCLGEVSATQGPTRELCQGF